MASEARNLAESLPKETHAAVWITNIEEARRNGGQNAFYQFLTHKDLGVPEDVRGLRGTVSRLPGTDAGVIGAIWSEITSFAEDTIADGTAYTSAVFAFSGREVVETFSGSVVLYSTMFKGFVEQGLPITEWDVIFAAEFDAAERDKVDRFLKSALSKVPDNARRSTRDYLGETLYHIEYHIEEEASLPGVSDGDGLGLVEQIPVLIEYAYVDGVFLLAEGREEPLKKAIRALKEPSPEVLLMQQPAFRRAEQSIDLSSHDFGAYYDLRHHIVQWSNLPELRSDAQHYVAMGLGKSGPLVAVGRFRPEAVTFDAVLAGQESHEGIWRLAREFPPNELDRLRRVPSDAIAFGSMSVDMVALFEEAVGYFTITNPQVLPWVQTGLTTVRRDYGVDLKEEVLSRVKGELVSYVRPGVTLPSGVATPAGGALIVPLQHGQGTVSAINQIMRGLTEGERPMIDLESSEIEGVTVWESKEADTERGRRAPGTHFAAATEALAVATSGAELRAALRSIRGEGSSSVMTNEHVRQVVSEVPRDGLLAFSMLPLEATLLEYDRTRDFERHGRPSTLTQLRGFNSQTPSREELEQFLGDTWWTLHHEQGNLKFHYRIEAPTRQQ